MKKTIAILLVLVIGMAGVFAATADALDSTLQIQTAVNQVTGFKVTQAAADENATYADFTGMPTADLLSVDGTGAFTGGSTAYITAANNDSSAYTIGVTAEAMAGETTPDNLINYKVSISGTEKWDTANPGNTAEDVLTVTGLTTGLLVKSLPITIELYTDEYNSAAPDTYVGIITFSVTSN
jgi:hypothetical protein